MMMGAVFFWVRVMVDVTSPLCRGRVITLPNGKNIGQNSDTSTCQVYAIGVGAWTTMIGIVIYGFRAMDL